VWELKVCERSRTAPTRAPSPMGLLVAMAGILEDSWNLLTLPFRRGHAPNSSLRALWQVPQRGQGFPAGFLVERLRCSHPFSFRFNSDVHAYLRLFHHDLRLGSCGGVVTCSTAMSSPPAV
jgi:hypothetical protein